MWYLVYVVKAVGKLIERLLRRIEDEPLRYAARMAPARLSINTNYQTPCR